MLNYLFAYPTRPDQHDYDMIASAYAHLDGYNTSHSAGVGGGCTRPADAELIAEYLGLPRVEMERHINFKLVPHLESDGHVIGILDDVVTEEVRPHLVGDREQPGSVSDRKPGPNVPC